jgi:hypothetical protein
MAKAKRKTQSKPKPVGHVRPNFEIGVQEVDNPDFSRDHAEDRLGNVRRIKAMVNLRESAISTLAARGLIDGHHVRAAGKFRGLWEAMGGAGAQAMDYTREPVDGGGIADPIKPRQIEAGKEMARARARLGVYGFKLVGYICGEGYAIHDLTQTRRQRDTMTDNLRTYLDELSAMWGYGRDNRSASDTSLVRLDPRARMS